MTTPERYRTVPVTVEAMLYDGTPESCKAIHAWAGIEHDEENGGDCASGILLTPGQFAEVGDYVVGMQGDFYVLPSEEFEVAFEHESTDAVIMLGDDLPLTKEQEIAFRKAWDASVVPSPTNGGERGPGAYETIVGSRPRGMRVVNSTPIVPSTMDYNNPVPENEDI